MESASFRKYLENSYRVEKEVDWLSAWPVEVLFARQYYEFIMQDFSEAFLRGPYESGNRYHARQHKQEYGDS